MEYQELFFGLESLSKMRSGRLGGLRTVSRGITSGAKPLVLKRERSGRKVRSRLFERNLEILCGYLAQVLREVLEVSTSTTIDPTLSLLMIRRRMKPLRRQLNARKRLILSSGLSRTRWLP